MHVKLTFLTLIHDFFDTRLKIMTPAPPVVHVTNMRYGNKRTKILKLCRAIFRCKCGAPVPRAVLHTPCSKRPKINRQTGEKCNVYDRRSSSRRSRKRLHRIDDRFSQAPSCNCSVAALSLTSAEDKNVNRIHEAFGSLSPFIKEYLLFNLICSNS